MLSAALGTQVIGSIVRPASYCGGLRLQADGGRAQPRRQPRRPEPELPRPLGGDARRCLAGCPRDRAARRRRRPASLGSSGPKPDARGGRSPTGSHCSRPPAGPSRARPCSASWEDAMRRLKSVPASRSARALTTPMSAAIERVRSRTRSLLSNRINTWEMRWFIRGCARTRRDQTQPRRCSNATGWAPRMTLADYRAHIKERACIRALYAELAASCEACVTLGSTGRSAGLACNRPAARSSPCPPRSLAFRRCRCRSSSFDGMPLGLQVLGYAGEDGSRIRGCRGCLRDQLGGETE